MVESDHYILYMFQVISDLIPKETLIWKLKLLKSAAAYANSRLHAVKAEVLVLARFVAPSYVLFPFRLEIFSSNPFHNASIDRRTTPMYWT